MKSFAKSFWKNSDTAKFPPVGFSYTDAMVRPEWYIFLQSGRNDLPDHLVCHSPTHPYKLTLPDNLWHRPQITLASLNAARADKSFFGHPRGLATLFFTEMWERFSYYGMRAILIFYLTSSVAKGGLGFADSKAGAVYGLYASMVYLMCLAGGWIADRAIGQRRAVLIGGIFIACGEFCLVVPRRVGSSISAWSCWFAVPACSKAMSAPSSASCTHQGDPRRDSGFSLFYMGINIGALISPADLRLGRRAHQLAPRFRDGRTRHACRS